MLELLQENLWSLIQTAAIVIGAVVALFVYKAQERQKVVSAATLIKLDIDSVEKTINKLKEKNSFASILQTEPIYQKLEWYAVRHLLTSKLSFDI